MDSHLIKFIPFSEGSSYYIVFGYLAISFQHEITQRAMLSHALYGIIEVFAAARSKFIIPSDCFFFNSEVDAKSTLTSQCIFSRSFISEHASSGSRHSTKASDKSQTKHFWQKPGALLHCRDAAHNQQAEKLSNRPSAEL